MSEIEPMAEIARSYDPEFVLVPPEAHFDGVYSYAIALDPFARNQNVYTRVDLYEYRYGHPGYGWLSGIVALGDASRLPLAMLLVGLAAMGVAGWAVSRLAEHLDRSAWWGLIVAVNPGLVLSVTLLTSEPAGVALAAAGFLVWLRGRVLPAAALFASACLVKEPFALVPAGLFVWEIVQLIRRRAEPGVPFRLAALAASVLPLTLWYLYLKLHFGAFPFEEAPEGFGVPFTGWFDSFRLAVGFATQGASQVGTLSVALLTILAGAMLVGTVRAVRLRSPFDVMFLLFAIGATTFNWMLLVYPKDLVREFVLPLLLLPAVVGSVSTVDRVLPAPAEEEH